MSAVNQNHLDAAASHADAAELHRQAATLHANAAALNRTSAASGAPDAAAHLQAANQDAAAAQRHAAAAISQDKAASAHKSAALPGGSKADRRVKAADQSAEADQQSQAALQSSQNASSADPSAHPQASPDQHHDANNAAGHGQLALQKAQQASTSAADASAQSQDAVHAGTSSNDWLNSIIQALGLTGVFKSFVDHNRFTALGLAVSAAITINVRGCEPTVKSPISCSVVTEAELKTELENYTREQNEKINDLKQQLALKKSQVGVAEQQIQNQIGLLQDALKTVTTLAIASAPATGPIGPLIGVVSGLITAGLAGDNLRKRAVANQDPDAAAMGSE